MDLDLALCRRCPYDNYDPTSRPVGLRWGFGSGDEVLADCIKIIRPGLIIEVGSFEGGSSIFMAKKIKELGLDTKIICVDTWLGAPEHLMQQHFKGVLEEANGYPQLYYRFLGNVIEAGVQDVISPFPNTSENAAVVLSSFGIRADIIFIDAAHEHEPVARDLRCYWELLKDPGVLIADDYMAWPGVTSATNDFARANKLNLLGRFGKGIIQKGLLIKDQLQGLIPVAL